MLLRCSTAIYWNWKFPEDFNERDVILSGLMMLEENTSQVLGEHSKT